MFYQWGRKEPFTFATSSRYNGNTEGYGKYPAKIYNGKRELIYQIDSGGDNTGKTPVGGVRVQVDMQANSMMEIVKTPALFYGPSDWSQPFTVINQTGHNKELFNYYWTSYSRGTDGNQVKETWHNTYLDGYIVLRSKSIYDPCPYGYRTPANGTYNDFILNTGWTAYSYNGGGEWNNVFISSIGSYATTGFVNTGGYVFLWSSSSFNNLNGYFLLAYSASTVYLNAFRPLYRGFSIRCIEDATVKADQSEASASLSTT